MTDTIREWGYGGPLYEPEDGPPGPDCWHRETDYPDAEEYVRAEAEALGGEVWTREVTEWRKA